MSRPTSSSKSIFDTVLNNDLKGLKHLVETRNISVTQINDDEETPAHIAAKAGNLAMLKYLLDRNEALAAAKDLNGNTVLDLAAENGALPAVEHLLEVRQVDVHRTNNLRVGNTVLHIAAQAGQLAVLKYLFEKKNLNPDLRNYVEQTPAFLAAYNKHVNVIKYLAEERGANLTLTDYHGDNILYMSAPSGDLKVPKYILDEKKIDLDVNWRNKVGETVLVRAARFDQLEFIKYFVEEKHVNLNEQDFMGKSVLHEAATKGHIATIRYLVEKGANTELQDLYNNTPLKVSLDQDVRDYLNQTKRARRSLSETLMKSRPFSTHSESYAIEGSASKVAAGSSLFEIEGFLVLARACMRSAKRLHSPPEVIIKKFDPLALDVVNYPS